MLYLYLSVAMLATSVFVAVLLAFDVRGWRSIRRITGRWMLGRRAC